MQDTAAVTERSDRHRYLRSAAVGAALAWVLFVLIISYGRGDLLHRETFGGFYDAQADALLDGHLDVDPDAVRFEGFRMGDRTYVYQGLIPAIARMPVVAVTDRFVGRLTGLSMALAFAVGMLYVVRLLWRTRVMVRGPDPVTFAEVVRAGFLAFGLGATTLLFLASKAWIYHEALLWGAVLAVASLTHLLDWVSAPEERVRPLVWSGLFAFAAINTRFSLGLGAIAALGLVGAAVALDALVRTRRPSWTERTRGWVGFIAPARWTPALAVMAVAVVLSLGSYGAVNHARFGTPFGLPIDKQVLVGFDQQFQRALADNGGSLFGLRYTPSQLWQLVRPDAIGVQRSVPFLSFPGSPPAAVGDVVLAEQDWSSSLPVSEPLLVLGGLVGLAAIVVPIRMAGRRGPAGARLPVLGSLAAASGFGLIGYVAFRYQADLWPTLAIVAAIGVHTAGGWWDARRRSGALLTVAVAALALWGGWVNTALAVEYQRVIAPGAWDDSRAGWLLLQSRLGPTPPASRIGVEAPLPTPGPVGQVLAVADCQALYRSNGDLWYLLEGGPATGSYRGDLVVRGPIRERQVVLSGQGPDGGTELALEPAGDDLVRFTVLSGAGATSGTATAAGAPFRLSRGERLEIHTEVDWRTGFAEVRAGERELLSATLDLAEVTQLEPVPNAVVDPQLSPTDRPVCRALGG